jgi:hypothetical protein
MAEKTYFLFVDDQFVGETRSLLGIRRQAASAITQSQDEVTYRDIYLVDIDEHGGMEAKWGDDAVVLVALPKGHPDIEEIGR